MADGKRFEALTKYINLFEIGDFGKMQVNDTEEGVFSCHCEYSPVVFDFMHDVYGCIEANKDILDIGDYLAIVDKIEGKLDNADLSKLDCKVVLAVIVFFLRADRFCEGSLLNSLESGLVQKYLRRLAELDNEI